MPTVVQSRNPLIGRVVLLHPSKNELDLQGQRKGGQMFEVVYGGEIVRFETAAIEYQTLPSSTPEETLDEAGGDVVPLPHRK